MGQRLNPLPTSERLHELLAYNSETGALTWKIDRRGFAKAGTRAGTPKSDGYLSFRVDGMPVLAHRVVWCMAHGTWPVLDIDHINGDRSDNRLCNLRDVSRSVNCQNKRRARSDNSTGVMGVTSAGSKFLAQIMVDGVAVRLGRFDSPDVAHAAYLAAKRASHVGCTI